VIQVAHQNYGGDVLAPGTGKFVSQQIHNHPAVPESRQPVMSGPESHFLACLDQTVFEIEDSQSGVQARFQLFGVKWFGQVIIGPDSGPATTSSLDSLDVSNTM
jgi:hypothetical protein